MKVDSEGIRAPKLSPQELASNTPKTTRRRRVVAIKTTTNKIMEEEENEQDWEEIPPVESTTRTSRDIILDDDASSMPTEGWRWWVWSWMLFGSDCLCLLGFILALMPGFVRFAWFYVVTANRVSLPYGTASCRQTVDVYAAATTKSGSKRDSATARKHIATKQINNNNKNIIHPEMDDDDASHETGSTASSSSDDDVQDEERDEINGSASHHTPMHDAAPTANSDLSPVVLFFPGGAWMIGYKMWAALTARVLVQFGIVTVVADYRNRLPLLWEDVTMPDMVKDVSLAIDWTLEHIAKYGGDPSRVTIVGQSAGGHLSTTALLKRAMELQKQQQQPPNNQDGADSTTSLHKWKPTDLKGLVAVSAPYHFPQMRGTFRKHGLGDHVLNSMFGEGDCQDDYDPLRLVQRLEQQTRGVSPALPPIQVWHGARDATVPVHCAQEFAQALQQATRRMTTPNRPNVEFRLYPTWTHTDGILEGPMSGDHEFHGELAQLVHSWSGPPTQTLPLKEACWSKDHAVLNPMWTTKVMAQIGMFCNPF